MAEVPTNLHRKLTKRSAAGRATSRADVRRFATMAETRAKRRLGPSWDVVGEQIQGAFIALEAMKIIAAQDEDGPGGMIAWAVLEKVGPLT